MMIRPLSFSLIQGTDVGSFFGALAAMWVGDWVGRKKTIMLGTTLMLIGILADTVL